MLELDLHRIAAVAQAEKPEAVKETGLAGKKKSELEEIVRQKELRVRGEGKGGSVLKADLVRVLTQGPDEDGETLGEREEGQRKADEEQAAAKAEQARAAQQKKHDRSIRYEKPLVYKGQITQSAGPTLEPSESPTNSSFVAALADRAGIPKVKAKKLAGAFWRNVLGRMTVGGSTPIPGIGTIQRKWVSPKSGRHPKTGEPIKIKGRFVYRFDTKRQVPDKLSAEMIAEIAEDAGLSFNDFDQAVKAVEAVQALARANLKKHGTLPLGKFGRLNLGKTKQRFGRNPKTGQRLIIKPQDKITFKASKTHLPPMLLEQETDDFIDRDWKRVVDDFSREIKQGMTPEQFAQSLIDEQKAREMTGLIEQAGGPERFKQKLADSVKSEWPEIQAKLGVPDEGKIVEKAQEEDPGISGKPSLTPKKPGAVTEGEAEEATDDLGQAIGLDPETKPEEVPTSGEIPAFRPDAKLPEPAEIQAVAGDLQSTNPEEVKQKLDSPEVKQKTQSLLRSIWDGLTLPVRWAATKLAVRFMRPLAGLGQVIGPVLEGHPEAGRTQDFIQGLVLAGLATGGMMALGGIPGVLAAAGAAQALKVTALVALTTVAYSGGKMMGGAAFEGDLWRKREKLNRAINRKGEELVLRGELSPEQMERGEEQDHPEMAKLYAEYDRIEAAMEAEDAKAKALKEQQRTEKAKAKRAKKREKLQQRLKQLEEQERAAVSVDLLRISKLAVTDPQTEASINLDRIREVLTLMQDAGEGYEERVKEMAAKAIAGLNAGEIDAEEFDPISIMREAAQAA